MLFSKFNGQNRDEGGYSNMISLSLFLSFFTSILITPLVKKIALRINAIDRPDQRKVHQSSMPRLGGIAIYISFLVGLVLISSYFPFPLLLIVGSLIILITGILDDMIGLSPKLKILGQLIAASIIILFGDVQISLFTWVKTEWLQQYLSYGLSLLWVLFITNSFNLIDGLDGLASGISSIILLVISIYSMNQGLYIVSIVCLLLLSSILGFLLHNFYPATIFLGDTGSLFIGYMISIITLLVFDTSSFSSLIIPLIIMAIPILDTVFAIVRRITNNNPLFSADRSHIHHQLLNLGISHRNTVIILYLLTASLGAIAILLTNTNTLVRYSFLFVLLILSELIAESIGWSGDKHRPILKLASIVRIVSKKEIKIK